MSIPELHLFEGCKARFPQVVTKKDMTVEEVREHTNPLLVLTTACNRLREDLRVFMERGPYHSEGRTREFLLSVNHHRAFLLSHMYKVLQAELQGYHDVQANDFSFKGRAASIGGLLFLAEKGIVALNGAWQRAVLTLNLNAEHYTISPGTIVPTAAPRQLLVSLLLHHPIMTKKMDTMGASTVLMDIGKHLNLPPAPKVNFGEFVLKDVRADGAPKMFFVCHHTSTNGIRELYVGANLADWEGLPAVRKIRKDDRNYRLSTYSSLVTKAYQALYEAEQRIVLPASMSGLGYNEQLYQKRFRAVAAMKEGPHPDFLGRKSETGQPFNKQLKPQQCCYACQGMMGYQVPTTFAPEHIKSYLCHFNWARRGGNALACAEIEASLQCSRDWQRRGMSPKK